MCLNTSTTNNNREGRGLLQNVLCAFLLSCTVQDIHINNEGRSINGR